MRRSNTSGANEQTVPCRFQHHFGEWLSEIAKYISLLLGVSGVSLHAIQSNVKRSKSAAQPKSITRQNVTGTNATRYALYNNEVQPVAKTCVNTEPVVLVSLDNSYLGITKKTVHAGPNQSIAIDTQLGWVVYGPLNRSQVIQPRVLHVRDSHSLKEFHKLVQEFGVRSSSLVLDSVDNRLVRKVMEDTTKRSPENMKWYYYGEVMLLSV
ncbi:unnamed protein product [Ceratitis capitata]|uniref:(Mediterranean fruit fly) hypothetical protein n=1 Tax=Ceratitis capitata TaxID=7213 RepID=A0A811UTQ4_CERCA|nr:unnamed protein product [Ceratitis capitata]